MPAELLKQYLTDCRALVMAQVEQIVPTGRYRPILYELILDYPMRGGKAFRPSLCIAACRAMGGRLHEVLRTAAVLELYHNGFLIHDDVEDGSLLRRSEPTLHRDYGLPIAVNVGDGIFAICLQPLLDNMELLGLGKALRIMQIVARMVRESVEGQAVELDWVRHGKWQLRDRDYCLMCYKKTCWYTFIAPLQIGGLIAGATDWQLAQLRKYATYVGIAFQIQDDLLNLTANEALYGKEIGGDLWEGKHTIMLMHMMRSANAAEQRRAAAILHRPRPDKQESEVAYLYDLIQKYESIGYARAMTRRLAMKSQQVFHSIKEWLPPSVHRSFIVGMAEYVITRDK